MVIDELLGVRPSALPHARAIAISTFEARTKSKTEATLPGLAARSILCYGLARLVVGGRRQRDVHEQFRLTAPAGKSGTPTTG